jgi:uncharacterized membrane protein YebE (DUF533 family)
MKKTMLAVLASIALLSGCSTTNTGNSATPAQIASDGQIAALGWIAAEKPSMGQQQAVATELLNVKAHATALTGSSTNSFAATVTPVIVAAVNSDNHIPATDKALINAGIAILMSQADAHAGSVSMPNLADKTSYLFNFIGGALSVLPSPAQ